MGFVKVRKIIKKEIEIQDLPKLIAQAQKDSGRSISEVCRSLEMSSTYWYRLINGREEAIALETLIKIEELLGVNFGVNFEGKGND